MTDEEMIRLNNDMLEIHRILVALVEKFHYSSSKELMDFITNKNKELINLE
jgi:hypothetical protein